MKSQRMTQFPRSAFFGTALLFACGLPPPPVIAAENATVTGGGIALFGNAIVSVNAVRDSQGNVSGQFEQVHHPSGGSQQGGVPDVHGSVNCLDIEGNIAFIGGVLTSVKNLPPQFNFIQVGLPFYLAVQDNGQGGSAVPDNWSQYTVTPPGTFGFCSDPGLDAFLISIMAPLLAGNVHISQ